MVLLVLSALFPPPWRVRVRVGGGLPEWLAPLPPTLTLRPPGGRGQDSLNRTVHTTAEPGRRQVPVWLLARCCPLLALHPPHDPGPSREAHPVQELVMHCNLWLAMAALAGLLAVRAVGGDGELKYPPTQRVEHADVYHGVS